MSKKGVMPAGLKRYWAKHKHGSGKKSKGKGVSMSKGKSRKAKMTIPLAVVAGFIPIINEGRYWYKHGGFSVMGTKLQSRLFPYDPVSGKFTTVNLKLGLYPILAGFLVHKIVGGTLGLNRMLSRSGVPFIRI